MLEETPWLRQAQTESQARRNVGILFDDNRLNDETRRAPAQAGRAAARRRRLAVVPRRPRQRLHHALHHHRLRPPAAPRRGHRRHLRGQVARPPRRLDRRASTARSSSTGDKDDNHLNSTIALYLYGRSFFLKDKPIDGAPRRPSTTSSARRGSTGCKLDCRQSQAHLAVALKRFGDQANAAGHHEVHQGTFRQQRGAGHVLARHRAVAGGGIRAPIETQALMIEAFDEVMNDAQAVEDCKVWLLKQKQTQDWKTTKATADAVYACCCAARTCWPPTRWSRCRSAARRSSPRRSKPAPASTRSASPAARSSRSWARSP